MRGYRLIVGWIGLISVSVTFAQTPTALQIEKEQQRIKIERKRLFDVPAVSVAHPPNAFPAIPTPARAGIDLETVAQQYEKTAARPQTDNLMIFASFSMPQASLKRLVHQAHQVGASVILRGFKANSLKATALAIEALGEPGGNVLINPKTFSYYKIDAVPTVVLTQTETKPTAQETDCALPGHFVAVTGDVSLDYALANIAQRAPQWEAIAKPYLKRFK